MRIMKYSRGIYLTLFLYVTWTHCINGTKLKRPRPIHKDKGSDETTVFDPPNSSLLQSDTENTKLTLVEGNIDQTLNPVTDGPSRNSNSFDSSDQTISGSSFLDNKVPLANPEISVSSEDSGLLFDDPHLNGKENINHGPLKVRNAIKRPANKPGLLLDNEHKLTQTSEPQLSLITPQTQSNHSQAGSVTQKPKTQNDNLFDHVKKDPNLFSSRHKPSGSIYVETVHKSVYPERSLRIGTSVPCPITDFEDKDLHKLSHSQFGFPKSIVSRALDESHLTMMLKMLEDQIQILTHQNENKTDVKDLLLSPRTKLSTTYVNHERNTFPVNKGRPSTYNIFGVQLPNSDLQFDLFNGIDSTIRQDEKEDALNPRPAFNPYSNLKFPFKLENDIRNVSPNLLEDSAFESQLALSPHRQSSSEEPRSQRNELSRRKDQFPVKQPILPDQLEEKEYMRELQTKEDEQKRFSKNLPDVSGNGGPWFTSSIYPGTTSSFDMQHTKMHDSGIDRLFPPKSSGSFLGVSSVDEFGRNNPDSFIKYSPDRSSAVSSPFQFDTKSLFSSLSGVSVAEDPSQQSSGKSLSEFQPQTSAFPHEKFTSLQIDSSKKLNEGFQNSRFGIPRGLRRKRQAGKERPSKGQQQIEDACSASHKLLRQYKNHGGSCFVVHPEIQGIHFATCTNSRCRGCHVDGGDSRCQALHVPMWVWSYCEEGPNAGQVMADRVAVSVACICKVSICTL